MAIGFNKAFSAKARAELEKISAAHGGPLTPAQVLEWAAANKRSELHKMFEWDDSAAAEAHRLEQAGRILRVYVKYIVHPRKTTQINVRTEARTPVRGFVSLSCERLPSGNTVYRPLEQVMSDPELRAIAVADVLRELLAMKRKYEMYTEFEEVWAAIASYADAEAASLDDLEEDEA